MKKKTNHDSVNKMDKEDHRYNFNLRSFGISALNTSNLMDHSSTRSTEILKNTPNCKMITKDMYSKVIDLCSACNSVDSNFKKVHKNCYRWSRSFQCVTTRNSDKETQTVYSNSNKRLDSRRRSILYNIYTS